MFAPMRRWKLALAPMLWLATACADPDLRAGDEALGAGRYPDAIAAFERARTRLPDVDVDARLASAHRARGTELLEAGRCDAARPHFTLAEAMTRPLLPDHEAIYKCDATQNAAPEVLIEDLARMVALGDRRTRVIRKLMHLELEVGRWSDAVTRVQVLEERRVLTLAERRMIADGLLRLDRGDAAYDHLVHVVASDPMDPLLRLKLAELTEKRGHLDKADRLYGALVVDFRKNPLVFVRYAEFLRRRGHPDKAAVMQTRAEDLWGRRPPPARRMRTLPRSKR
jgi:tetratricopeptide (TPR) repeat protein